MGRFSQFDLFKLETQQSEPQPESYPLRCLEKDQAIRYFWVVWVQGAGVGADLEASTSAGHKIETKT